MKRLGKKLTRKDKKGLKEKSGELETARYVCREEERKTDKVKKNEIVK